ncbi:hypothetical protein PN499_06800 [Kamptonema animale CS-326]|uniref:hypothetical protein n=1 Tax=Kamptonema animale TaxID=92934 RepID=UPI00232D0F2D|nr:hypothetical protein [Kamptonema animale]MDB9510884.1 hypothetical protein [Kamptonema animale CS-326]
MNWHCIFKNIKNREFRLRDLITPMSSILVVNLGKAFPKTGRAIERIRAYCLENPSTVNLLSVLGIGAPGKLLPNNLHINIP